MEIHAEPATSGSSLHTSRGFDQSTAGLDSRCFPLSRQIERFDQANQDRGTDSGKALLRTYDDGEVDCQNNATLGYGYEVAWRGAGTSPNMEGAGLNLRLAPKTSTFIVVVLREGASHNDQSDLLLVPSRVQLVAIGYLKCALFSDVSVVQVPRRSLDNHWF